MTRKEDIPKPSTLNPAEFELGSPKSRAAVRAQLESQPYDYLAAERPYFFDAATAAGGNSFGREVNVDCGLVSRG